MAEDVFAIFADNCIDKTVKLFRCFSSDCLSKFSLPWHWLERNGKYVLLKVSAFKYHLELIHYTFGYEKPKIRYNLKI